MRRLFVGLAAPVVFVIAAILAIPFVVPLDAYRNGLIAAVKQSTGRDLRIAGPVRLSLLPAPAVEASDVSLGNPSDAGSAQMVTVTPGGGGGTRTESASGRALG